MGIPSTDIPRGMIREQTLPAALFDAPSPVAFFVPGIPAPQGSKKYVGNGIMVESSKKVKPWRAAVGHEAMVAMAGRVIFEGPVSVHIVFHFPRPKGHFRSSGAVKPGREWHVQKPDIDKLERAVFDAMKGIAWRDDSQVVESLKTKRWTTRTPGAEIVIRRAGDAPSREAVPA